VVALTVARPRVGQVHLARLDGNAFLLAGGHRYDVSGRRVPIAAAELARLGARLGAVRNQGLLTIDDAYYFSHHRHVELPVWRVIRIDGARFYLDPRTGELVASADTAAQAYRWLHLGLHRLDFVRGWSGGPGWAAAMIVLLLAVTLSVATGVWLGLRRLRGDAARIIRPRRIT
jgi:hypothetical protein